MSQPNIYLLGFMSSGKSKIGRKLAKRLNRKFLDLDAVIRQMSGKSIPQIFEQDGEDFFRHLESKALKEIQPNEGLVIALGGGTVCNEDNLAHVKRSGISVYLKIHAEILIGRLRQNIGERPLLQNLSTDQLAIFVREKLALREKYYAQADCILELDNPEAKDVEQILGLS